MSAFKLMYLCFSCAEDYKDSFVVTRHKLMTEKHSCEKCGKRCYADKYALIRRQKE